ncbi:MAG: hypothetical protein ACKOS8_15225, partial [Gemmataceae bacterium]
ATATWAAHAPTHQSLARAAHTRSAHAASPARATHASASGHPHATTAARHPHATDRFTTADAVTSARHPHTATLLARHQGRVGFVQIDHDEDVFATCR